jgi:hypothetical protein
MGGTQPCIVCTVQRRIVRTEPVTKSYEIHTLECPKCGSQVRLVQRTPRNIPSPLLLIAPHLK